MSAENWADTIPDDLSCDRCSHAYASHSHETGKCADAEVETPGKNFMDLIPAAVTVTPCWCRNFEPPYPPAREEV